ncbi:adventurous gliding motility protein AgmC [Melittangium boletus]|uniref:Bacterial Ig-like domain-containing protein n=1 Tax=Melittangium boletus DSM 14713 TaxID=1294270 RepID=A0A250IAW0_9BACT|nr:hypothetical protein [Melittangium boletus]ATB28999.1 hypothetical protein MEBOL_002448 [Melittangium boletus DSM 14713]
MRTPFMRKWLPAAMGVLALGSTSARAEPDTFGVGTGRNGALTVPTGSAIIVNAYAPVTAPLARKALSISVGACVGDPCFKEGDLILVYQATGLVPAPVSGALGPVDLTNSPVGRWELARLKSVTPQGTSATLELTAPLVHNFAANVTQVIRVPEYTSVSVPVGRSITASPWDGSTGGVVAFLAQNEVNNQGIITVDGLGFRGGQYVADLAGGRGCSEVDQSTPSGSQKGEGIGGAARYGSTQTGRGNVANGAGGAVCFRSGGGGGGNGGSGGQGGRSDGASDGGRNVGGLGGVALNTSVLTQLTFGGGGGAGHGTVVGGTAGAGGGVVFLRASQLSGSGTITASGGSVGTFSEGGSGGGAGGSIYARVVRSAVCGAVVASGGIGSTSSLASGRVGPGGGGGAGQMLFQASLGGSCALVAEGAAPGGQLIPAEGAYGATKGESSDPTKNKKEYGFIIPTPPSVSTPATGLITNNVRPRITGTARIYAEAAPNTEVILFLDGEELGRVMSDDKGNYSFDLPRDLSESEHRVETAIVVDAAQSLNGTPNTFLVDITPPRTTISGPNGAIRERNPKFEFGANEEGVTYTCSLDGAEFGPCPADGVFPELVDGAHSLQVRAEDRAGNVGEPTIQNFKVTVADLALLGDGVGCSSAGRDTSLLLFSLGALAMGLRRRRHGGSPH